MDEDFKPQREIVREMETVKADNRALRADLQQKSIVLDKYQNELRRYRSQAFLGLDYPRELDTIPRI